VAALEDTSVRRGDLGRFWQEFHRALTARADALFELTDAVLCADGPVGSLVELTLVGEHRRGHGAMYDALGHLTELRPGVYAFHDAQQAGQRDARRCRPHGGGDDREPGCGPGRARRGQQGPRGGPVGIFLRSETPSVRTH
jgi:hypothetical protein